MVGVSRERRRRRDARSPSGDVPSASRSIALDKRSEPRVFKRWGRERPQTPADCVGFKRWGRERPQTPADCVGLKLRWGRERPQTPADCVGFKRWGRKRPQTPADCIGSQSPIPYPSTSVETRASRLLSSQHPQHTRRVGHADSRSPSERSGSSRQDLGARRTMFAGAKLAVACLEMAPYLHGGIVLLPASGARARCSGHSTTLSTLWRRGPEAEAPPSAQSLPLEDRSPRPCVR